MFFFIHSFIECGEGGVGGSVGSVTWWVTGLFFSFLFSVCWLIESSSIDPHKIFHNSLSLTLTNHANIFDYSWPFQNIQLIILIYVIHYCDCCCCLMSIYVCVCDTISLICFVHSFISNQITFIHSCCTKSFYLFSLFYHSTVQSLCLFCFSILYMVFLSWE